MKTLWEFWIIHRVNLVPSLELVVNQKDFNVTKVAKKKVNFSA